MKDLLLSDLRHLMAQLGQGGGLVSASVYDTAQVVRFAPPSQPVEPAIGWLLSQQQADGGWGPPDIPLARALPTLAVALALHGRDTRKAARESIQAGLRFLRQQEHLWATLSSDAPVGIELNLTRLLEAAAAAGLDVPLEPYATLFEMRRRRLRLIARMSIQAGSSPVHSWEGWGATADVAAAPAPTVIDPSGGVGHSPAATAVWRHYAAQCPELAEACARAQRYLESASAATGLGVPCVVPTVWPIIHFERTWGLLALQGIGMLLAPELRAVIAPQLAEAAAALKPGGVGMSDDFEPDGDTTGATVTVLRCAGQEPNLNVVKRFRRERHFYTYPMEIGDSLTTSGHATHALVVADEDAAEPIQYLVERQAADGRWERDKWHTSWLYTTTHIAIGLAHSGATEALRRARDCLLAAQRPEGGWGAGRKATATETGYTVPALLALQGLEGARGEIPAAIRRATHWLLEEYRPFSPGADVLWIGKEPYRPYRVDRAFELTAMLAGLRYLTPEGRAA
ncbi:MAG TPA: prenyltransferase/squalene oxidase repeat-containing protein [Polyangia bacterium]|nr:prenyltransferase/squalene oxidase repeat-containing protein [Polyangia bacterium]